METENVEKKKSAAGQISFKTSIENKAKMESAAHELGLTLSEYIKLLLEGNAPSKSSKENVETKEKPKETVDENPEIKGNSVVFLRELTEKTDTTNDLLGKIVESFSPKTEVQTDEDINGRIDEAVAAALSDQEEAFRADFLMLRLTDRQKALLTNLMTYRNEKGEKFSDTIENFFFSLVKEKFYSAWFSTVPEGFDQEFKEAFTEYFESKEEGK